MNNVQKMNIPVTTTLNHGGGMLSYLQQRIKETSKIPDINTGKKTKRAIHSFKAFKGNYIRRDFLNLILEEKDTKGIRTFQNIENQFSENMKIKYKNPCLWDVAHKLAQEELERYFSEMEKMFPEGTFY